MITYKIKENNENIKKAIIVKTGHEVEFTLERAEYNQVDLLKMKKEVEATLNHHSLVVDNVLEHNPFIKDLTDEQVHAVNMFYESNSVKKQCVEKLSEIDEVLVSSAMEIAEIKKQLGIEDEVVELQENNENQTNEE